MVGSSSLLFLLLTSTHALADVAIIEDFTLPTFFPPVPVQPSVLPLTPENCTVLLEKFSNASARFTRCANKFAKPISMCVKCKQDYLNVTEFYTKLSQTNQDGVVCKNILTSVDRVEIIEATIRYIACPTTGLWARASCNDCYTLPLTVASTINDRASNFFNIRRNVSDCFSEHPVNQSGLDRGLRSSACDDCWPAYKSLTEFFKWNIQDRGDSSITGICFDVVDAMNITQRMWGKDYQCTRNKQSNPILITLVSFVLCTPVAFYVLVRVSATGTRERVVVAPNITDLLQQAARYVHRQSNAFSVDRRSSQAASGNVTRRSSQAPSGNVTRRCSQEVSGGEENLPPTE